MSNHLDNLNTLVGPQWFPPYFPSDNWFPMVFPWFSHGFPNESQEFYPHGFAGELDLVPEGLPGLPGLSESVQRPWNVVKVGELWMGKIKSMMIMVYYIKVIIVNIDIMPYY